jgi:hypothetical protein
VIAAHRGLVDDARALAEDALGHAEVAQIAPARAGHTWVLGFLELSLGNLEPALEHMTSARELREKVGHGEPGHHYELPDLLEALVSAGEPDEAEALLARWEERARALDQPWVLAIAPRCRALVLDETCFHVFDAPSPEAVAEVRRRAGLGSARIVAVIERRER